MTLGLPILPTAALALGSLLAGAAAQAFAPSPAGASILAPGPAEAEAMPRLRPQGLLTMRSLKVANNGAEGSRIFMGPQADISMGVDSAGTFLVQKAPHSTLLALDTENVLHLGAARTEAASLDVSAAGGISIRGVKQWQLAHSEGFAEEGNVAEGWSKPQVTHCGGVFMLGGYCKLGAGEVSKTVSGLPPHTQLRVRAVFHFIDKWIGESGYLKLDVGQEGKLVAVWSEQHQQEKSVNGLSLCGQGDTPEGKFAVPIDVTIMHSGPSVQLHFGSTMDNNDPCDESWGVSGIELYVRS